MIDENVLATVLSPAARKPEETPLAPITGEIGKETTSGNPADIQQTPAGDITQFPSSPAVFKSTGKHKKYCRCTDCLAAFPERKNEALRSRPSSVELPAPTRQPITDAERIFAREAIKSLTHTADSCAILYFVGKLKQGGADAETIAYAKSKIIMAEPTRDGIVTNGVIVAEKYNLLRMLPEWCLGLHLANYASGLMALASELNQFLKKKPIPAAVPPADEIARPKF